MSGDEAWRRFFPYRQSRVGTSGPERGEVPGRKRERGAEALGLWMERRYLVLSRNLDPTSHTGMGGPEPSRGNTQPCPSPPPSSVGHSEQDGTTGTPPRPSPAVDAQLGTVAPAHGTAMGQHPRGSPKAPPQYPLVVPRRARAALPRAAPTHPQVSVELGLGPRWLWLGSVARGDLVVTGPA